MGSHRRFSDCYICAKSIVMIQRIQSVYLALALLSMALMFAFKVAGVNSAEGEVVLTIYGVTLADAALNLPILAIPLYVYTLLIIAVLLVQLLMFRNRKTQMAIGRAAYLLILGFVVLVYFAADQMTQLVVATDELRYGAGVYFPVAAVAFVFLANRSIKKDEELVRSLDRLR